MYICTKGTIYQMEHRSEIEITDGRLFLNIEGTLTPEDEGILRRDGWKLLNNGTTLNDGTPSLYFCKII